LIITTNEEVYTVLYKVIGPRKISRFVKDMVRLHIVKHDLVMEYREMSNDEGREMEAFDWAEVTLGDSVHE
jgi:hypothetical protein